MAASIIVTYDRNRVIGNNGSVPWRISEDMRLFRQRTLGHTCIMGRKTFESYRDIPALQKLPVPHLPERKNIVITSQFEQMTHRYINDMIRAAQGGGSLPLHFVSLLMACSLVVALKPENCFIVGGEQTYKHFLDEGLVDRIWASVVDGEHEGDAFFPEPPGLWKEASRHAYSGFNLVELVKVV